MAKDDPNGGQENQSAQQDENRSEELQK